MSPVTTALLVDDEMRICRLLQRLLNAESIESLLAENGRVALELLEENEVDFIVTDLRMPEMDGLKFLRKARQLYPTVPIVVMSAFGDESTIIQSLQTGANDFLRKPFNLHTIENVLLPIIRLLEGKRDPSFDYSRIHHLQGEIRLDNDEVGMIPSIVNYLLQHWGEVEKYSKQVSFLEITLYQLILGAIEQGNLGIALEEKEEAQKKNQFSSLLEERLKDPRYQNRQVRIQFDLNPDQISISITDEGDGRHWPYRHENSSGGKTIAETSWGIRRAQMSLENIIYQENANQITLTLSLSTTTHS
ncbi:response regulator [Deltaproteobacteria bacterium TL4]